MAEKYGGGAVKLWFGDSYTIIFSDPKLIRSIWTKNFESFSNRPHTPTFHQLSGGFKNLSASDYDLWKRNRENVAQVFTKTKLKQIATDVIDKNSLALINKMKEYQATNEPFEPEIYFKKYAFNIILNMGFSIEIPYDESVGDGILGELVEPIEAVIVAISLGNICDYFEVLSPIYLAYQGMTVTPFDKIINVIRRIYKEHAETIDRENPRDVLDQLIIAYPDPVDLQTILQISFDMFVAGTETSATTLSWFVVHMVNNPDIQTKAYAELVDVIGKGNTPTVDHRIDTPYTFACIKEVLRMIPIAPLGIPRIAKEDIMIGDVFVPKNTHVIHNLYALAHDKSYWVDPEVYLPERFIGNNHTEYWLPFSVGPRDCVGKNLAIDELYVACASMLMNFNFKSTDGQPLDTAEKFGVTIAPATKIKVLLEARS
eukprot:gene9150-10735_t